MSLVVRGHREPTDGRRFSYTLSDFEEISMKRLPLPLCVLLLFLLPSLLAAQLPLGPQFQVSVHRQLSATSPQVAINASGSFVALWYGPGDLTGGVLRARRFEAAGEPPTRASGAARHAATS